MGVIDDERHLVFECSYFEHIRAARRSLFSAAVGEDMMCFMRQRDQKGVFWYIVAYLRAVANIAEIGTCYNSSAT